MEKDIKFYPQGPLPGWIAARDAAAATVYAMLLNREMDKAKNGKGNIDYEQLKLLSAEAWDKAEVFILERPHVDSPERDTGIFKILSVYRAWIMNHTRFYCFALFRYGQ
jgi:hypothetical protein